jgi:hypothetical protein
MAWVDDLRAYLALPASGLSLTAGTNLFVSDMPTTPDKAVCLYDYGGTPPQFFLDGTRLERPSVQVVCRDATLANARTLADAVFVYMLGITSKTLNGKVWVVCNPNQTPFFLRRDEKERSLVVCNWDIMKHV